MGFPGNFEPRQEILDDIMGTTLNNHGDPYVGDHEFLNSMSFEVGENVHVIVRMVLWLTSFSAVVVAVNACEVGI